MKVGMAEADIRLNTWSILKTAEIRTGRRLKRKKTRDRRERFARKKKKENTRRTALFISLPHQIIEDGLEVVVGGGDFRYLDIFLLDNVRQEIEKLVSLTGLDKERIRPALEA